MNKGIYRLIFNHATGVFMVAGELAKTKTKTPSSG